MADPIFEALKELCEAIEARLNAAAARVTPATTADGLSPVEPAPRAPQGVTYEELVCLLREVEDSSLERLWKSSNQLQARHLLDHPRLGPLLRGEGAPAPKRVVLPEAPTKDVWNIPYAGRTFQVVALAVWAAARAEVERQQGGQADD